MRKPQKPLDRWELNDRYHVQDLHLIPPPLQKLAVMCQRRGLNWNVLIPTPGLPPEQKEGTCTWVSIFKYSDDEERQAFIYVTLYHGGRERGLLEFFWGPSGKGDYTYVPVHDAERIEDVFKYCLRDVGL